MMQEIYQRGPILAVLPFQMPLRTTLAVFSRTKPETWTSFTISLSLDTVLKRTVLNTGLSETPGVPNTEKAVSLELLEVSTTLLLNPTAPGPLQKTPGPTTPSTSPPRLRRTTQ